MKELRRREKKVKTSGEKVKRTDNTEQRGGRRREAM